MDVQYEGCGPDRERLDFIYRLKTSALIEGSLMTGAALAGASEDEIGTMEKIGRDVGLAFQIRDDILDVTSTMEVLGKPILSDEKNHKATYVTLEGLKKAEEDVEMISGDLGQSFGFPRIFAGADSFPGEPGKIKQTRNTKRYSRRR